MADKEPDATEVSRVTEAARQRRGSLWERRVVQRHVLAYAAAGLAPIDIAERLEKDHGIVKTEHGVRKMLDLQLQRWRNQAKKDAGDVLAQELQRLDMVMQSLIPKATNPAHPQHLSAIEKLLKVQERRARYLGLDAPDRHEHVITTGTGTDEEREQVERMRQAWLDADGDVVDATVVEDPPAIEAAS